MDGRDSTGRGGRFDAASDPEDAKNEFNAGHWRGKQERASRPFLGIQFRCCHTYGRIYRNDEATEYRGSCPRCGGQVKVPIGPGGQGSRFFSAG